MMRPLMANTSAIIAMLLKPAVPLSAIYALNSVNAMSASHSELMSLIDLFIVCK